MGIRGPLIRVTNPPPGTLVRVRDDLRMRRDFSARMRRLSSPAYIPLHGAPLIKIYPPKLFRIIEGLPEGGKDLILRAYEFADLAFKGEERKSGKPFIVHLVNTALIIRETMEVKDSALLAAALLHDVIEDTFVTYKRLKVEFGVEVANLVEAETKLSKALEKEERDLKSLTKLLEGMSIDPRVALLKAADNLDNMQDQHVFHREKQKEHARETLQIYVPLMIRMGVWEMWTKLMELALDLLRPKKYMGIKELYADALEVEKDELERFKNELKTTLDNAGIKYSVVEVRQRTIAEVFMKMKGKKRNLSQLLEANPLYLNFILVEINEADARACSAALDLIKERPVSGFQPASEVDRDYIRKPRDDGYRAKQHLFFKPGVKGRLLVTVTSRKMNQENRLGLAARGAEKGFKDGWQESIYYPWLNELVEDLKGAASASEVMGMVEDVTGEITIYTPDNRTIPLRPGSSIIDAAYKIHSGMLFEVVGATLEEKGVKKEVGPFYKLKGGEKVHIHKSADAQQNIRWLKHIKSPSARELLWRMLDARNTQEIMNDGLDTLDEASLRYYVRAEGLTTTRLFAEFLRDLEKKEERRLRKLGQENVKVHYAPEKILEEIGRGERDAEDLIDQIYKFYRVKLEEQQDRRESLELVILKIEVKEGKKAESRLEKALRDQKFEKIVFIRRPLKDNKEEIILGVNVFGGLSGGGLVGSIQMEQIQTLARLIGEKVTFLNATQAQRFLDEIERMGAT